MKRQLKPKKTRFRVGSVRILVANLPFLVADEQPSEREVADYEGRDR
jgi:hypothetical protein